ncbi:hypothetical protein PIB30_033999, partial [Stylosanthes scabra]|nr:hypothetical protein [Stylosanthes scabra]
MKERSSIKLAFMMTTLLILAIGLFIGLSGAEAKDECKDNGDCERLCDSGGCFKNCLEVVSACINKNCTCPYGSRKGQSAARYLETCKSDDECKMLCPSSCTIKTCDLDGE